MIDLKKQRYKKSLERLVQRQAVSLWKLYGKKYRLPLMKLWIVPTQRCRQISKSILEINALHQKNIFIRLRKRQRFNLILFATCGADQQTKASRTLPKRKIGKTRSWLLLAFPAVQDTVNRTLNDF